MSDLTQAFIDRGGDTHSDWVQPGWQGYLCQGTTTERFR